MEIEGENSQYNHSKIPKSVATLIPIIERLNLRIEVNCLNSHYTVENINTKPFTVISPCSIINNIFIITAQIPYLNNVTNASASIILFCFELISM